MKKHVIVSLVIIFGIAFTMSAFAQNTGALDRWEPNIAAFEKMDAEQMPKEGSILFIGSSSIVKWETLKEDFAPMPVINRGFGGSQIVDSIKYASRIIFPYKPSIIMLYAGDNDIGSGKSPETVTKDFIEFAETVHSRLPDTLIFYITIKPSISRWAMWDDMSKANGLIDSYISRHKNLGYLDTGTPMLGENGSMPSSELFVEDNLHLSAEGYKLWTSIVRPRLLANFGR